MKTNIPVDIVHHNVEYIQAIPCSTILIRADAICFHTSDGFLCIARLTPQATSIFAKSLQVICAIQIEHLIVSRLYRLGEQAVAYSRDQRTVVIRSSRDLEVLDEIRHPFSDLTICEANDTLLLLKTCDGRLGFYDVRKRIMYWRKFVGRFRYLDALVPKEGTTR
eukprot:TRINITY_DN27578_c0_g1_i1.p1 TRINITY_DN27578_c0_g1~~TRINITY_DN27578_c0_g1_i1.p1  ORF type:complete len:165 (+),score=4.36 TRINITY_DN27578_c0_g1_i1:369-863(+)